MKASKEAKRYIALMRKYLAKKNGVIPGYAFDDMRLFKLLEDKKKRQVARFETESEQRTYTIIVTALMDEARLKALEKSMLACKTFMEVADISIEANRVNRRGI